MPPSRRSALALPPPAVRRFAPSCLALVLAGAFVFLAQPARASVEPLPAGLASWFAAQHRDSLRHPGAALARSPLDESWHAPASSQTPADGQWTELDYANPASRYGAAVAYDSRRHRLLEFGGIEQYIVVGDLWAFDFTSQAWTQLQVAGPAPAARLYGQMVYDAADDALVLFGGSTGASILGDAWRLRLSGASLTWEPLPAGPSARYGHRMVWDGAGHRALVFGGTAGGPESGELWQLSLGASPAWTLLADGGTAVARQFMSLALDAGGAQLVMFGGYAGGSFLDDVETLPLAGPYAWTAHASAPGARPDARDGAAACVDPAGRTLVVQGGNGWSGVLSDTWTLALDGSFQWAEPAQSGTLPGARFLHALVWDTDGARIALIGGQGSPFGDDARPLVADLRTFAWTACGPLPDRRPLPFGGHGSAVDAARHRAIWLPAENDAWALDLAALGLHWTETGSEFQPGRSGYAVVRDAANDRMVGMMGRAYDAGLVDSVDTIALDALAPWSPLAVTSRCPAPREYAMAVYDARRHRALVYGGTDDYEEFFDDLWALDLSGSSGWTPLAVSGPRPEPRADATLELDAARDRLILYGGYADGRVFNDLWTLDLGADTLRWTLVLQRGELPAGGRAVASVLDPRRDRLLVLGGQTGSYGFDDRLHELDLATLVWHALAPVGRAPGVVAGGEFVYDPLLDRMLLWGFGRAPVWQLAFPRPTPALVALVEASAHANGIWLRWRVTGVAGAFDVQRDDGGGWSRVATVLPDGVGDVSFADADVRPGGRYTYRLAWAGGAPLAGSDASVTMPGTPSLALAAAGGTLRGGAFALRVALPDAAPARLSLLDVSGRVVASREVGALGAGEHVVTLDGGSLPPGLYLARLSRAGEARTTKVARLR